MSDSHNHKNREEKMTIVIGEDVKRRDAVVLAARMRPAGPHKDRRKRREKAKLRAELREYY